jgi:acyl carrier protein
MTVDKAKVVAEIIASALNVSMETITVQSSMQTVPQWDSLGQLTICLAIQERFGIKMNMDTITEATSVSKLIACIP